MKASFHHKGTLQCKQDYVLKLKTSFTQEKKISDLYNKALRKTSEKEKSKYVVKGTGMHSTVLGKLISDYSML